MRAGAAQAAWNRVKRPRHGQRAVAPALWGAASGQWWLIVAATRSAFDAPPRATRPRLAAWMAPARPPAGQIGHNRSNRPRERSRGSREGAVTRDERLLRVCGCIHAHTARPPPAPPAQNARDGPHLWVVVMPKSRQSRVPGGAGGGGGRGHGCERDAGGAERFDCSKGCRFGRRVNCVLVRREGALRLNAFDRAARAHRSSVRVFATTAAAPVRWGVCETPTARPRAARSPHGRLWGPAQSGLMTTFCNLKWQLGAWGVLAGREGRVVGARGGRMHEAAALHALGVGARPRGVACGCASLTIHVS